MICTSINSIDEQEIIFLLGKEWKEWHKQKVSARMLSKDLEEKLTKLEARNATNWEKSIKIIKHREDSCRIHRRVYQVLGRGTNSVISKKYIPVEMDGEVVGYRTITSELKELQKRVVESNHEHLNQAKPTPFKSGPGFELLHGAYRWTHMVEIIEGRSNFIHGREEVDNLVCNLRQYYNANKLQSEVALINKPITA